MKSQPTIEGLPTQLVSNVDCYVLPFGEKPSGEYSELTPDELCLLAGLGESSSSSRDSGVALGYGDEYEDSPVDAYHLVEDDFPELPDPSAPHTYKEFGIKYEDIYWVLKWKFDDEEQR